jgi:hypothetical protein
MLGSAAKAGTDKEKSIASKSNAQINRFKFPPPK